MRNLLLVFCLFSFVLLEEAPNIRQVTSQLSIVSRLTSGITIQNELLDSKLTEIQAMASMIHIKNPQSLESLKGGNVVGGANCTSSISDLQTSEASKKLDDLSTLLKPLEGESKVQKPGWLQKSLQVLSEFSNELETLNTASKTSLTDDFKAKALAITGGKVNIRETIVGKWPLSVLADSLSTIMNETMTAVPTEEKELFKLKNAILRFRFEMETYEEYIKKLKDYETELKTLFDYKDLKMDEVLKPVKIIKDVATRFDRTKLGGNRFLGWLTSLKEEADKLESTNIMKSQEQLEDLKKDLDALFPIVRDISAVRISPKPSQLAQIFKSDLSEKWFLDSFAEGDKKSIEKLKKSLTLLESFSEKATKITLGLNDFTSKYNRYQIFAFKRVFARVKNTVEKLKAFEEGSEKFKTALDSAHTCLSNTKLKSRRKEIDLELFEKSYEFAMKLYEKVTNLHDSIQKVLGIPEIENYDVLKKLNEETKGIKDDTLSNDEAWNIVEKMRKVADVDTLLPKLQEASTTLSETISSELDELLMETVDFDIIQTTQSILEDTNLIAALECLKNNAADFDTKHSFELMALGNQIRFIKEEDIQEAKGILESMEKIKTDLNSLDSKSKKTKRAAAKNETGEQELLKLEESKTIGSELESGVNTLNRLVAVIDQKESVLAATKFGEKVDKEIWSIRVPPMQSVWTPITRQKLKRLFEEIEQFEKMAGHYKTKGVESVFGIMENATSVNGLKLDSSLFKTYVPTSLSASKDSEVQAAAPVFEKLSSLDLDFAANHEALKTASLTFTPLRKFFDDFFGIDRTLKNAQAQNGTTGAGAEAENGPAASYLLLLAAVLIVFLVVLVAIIFCMKRRSRLAKLGRKETWRHLRFLSEGALTNNDGTQYTQLHLAVLKKRGEEVKRLVKNGAYVDVHCYGKVIETPLHTAVSNKAVDTVRFLIKHGADMDALDSNYETPLDRAKGNKEMLKIINGFKKKNFRKTLPQALPIDKYKIFIDEKVKGKKQFCDKFKQNIVSKIEKATHVIVKTGKDGLFELDKDDPSAIVYLGVVCSPKILMTSDWLTAAVQKKNNFRDDFKFQVKKIKFNGKTYKAIDDIQLNNSKMFVPYLTNAIIHFDQADLHTIDWTALKKVSTDLGAQNVDEFPVMQGMIPGKCPYYRDDLGHIFVIYIQSNADKLTALYPILKTEKAYTFLERDEFIAMLLSQEICHKKMKSTKKAKKSASTEGTTGTIGGTTGTACNTLCELNGSTATTLGITGTTGTTSGAE
ncbi:hypothetical protein CRE_24730 [Caenorhabditis remanei]|uniref:Domain of unknown function WSN domain-containing protein n=1 Tax=Caenorhabditis remanei TaxID=31234 RepID=E3N420_CAERE|nr:hypothetical protein CRE_24730 [Caenorhabditis remanei]